MSKEEILAAQKRLNETRAQYWTGQHNRIKNVMDRLTAQWDDFKGFTVQLNADEQTVNAQATLFRNVSITAGMMRVIKNDDELAMVLAHEMAHLQFNHVPKNISAGVAASVAGQAIGGVLSSYSPLLGNAANQMVATTLHAPYSQQMEREADQLAFQHLSKSGFDPRKGIEIWEKLAMTSPASLAPDFLSNHPSLPERFVRMRKLTEESEGQMVKQVTVTKKETGVKQ